MNAVEILKRWLQYAEYDPNQTSFNLLSSNYQLHKCCETIKSLLPFDRTGSFSVLYAKQKFQELLSDSTVNALTCVIDPNCLSAEKDMWALFSSKEVVEMEQQVLAAFDAFIQAILPTKMLGERHPEQERAALQQTIDALATELPKCGEDLFLRGGTITKIDYFSTSIHVYERLAECLFALERARDGVYVCFIRCDDTAEGYFGFYIKSNGTIISVNERVDETFPGSHGRSRNGRWTEAKKYCLFPYDFIFNFENFDYKGYAKNHKIDEERLEDDKLAFSKLEPAAYMPLALAMLMLKTKYEGFDPSGMQQKYVDSMLPVNLALPTPGTTALIVPSGSELAVIHKEMRPLVTVEDIMSPVYGDKFVRTSDNSSYHWNEYGSFRHSESDPTNTAFYDPYSDVDLFIRLYGQGFTVNVAELLQTDRHLKLLTSAELDAMKPEEKRPQTEFVGTERRMELISYYRGRQMLAKYIRQNMRKEYLEFGGLPAVRKWYYDRLMTRKDAVMRMCARAYQKFAAGEKQEDTNHLIVTCVEDSDKMSRHSGTYHYGWFNERLLTKALAWHGDLKCMYTGAKCCYYVTFQVESYFGLADLLGIPVDELPVILQGYRRRGHDVYGNSILDVTDEVSGIGTPFEERESRWNVEWKTKKAYQKGYFDGDKWIVPEPPADALDESPASIKFNFAVGFSKRGIKKLLESMPNSTKEESV